ncbi:MAG: hypothetical protein ACI4RC_06165 [Oscillospiraceae bacterium]
MLLHQYPNIESYQERQQKALNDLVQNKKIKKNMYRNLILAVIIGAIGFLVPVTIIKVVLWIIAAGNAVMAILLYKYSMLSFDPKLYTKIYDDHLEHCQGYTLSSSHDYIKFYYEDAVESFQTNQGNLVIKLREGYKSEIYTEHKCKKKQAVLKNNLLTLRFQETESKLFLINNLYEKIKYPHKEYNVIEDPDDWEDN